MVKICNKLLIYSNWLIESILIEVLHPHILGKISIDRSILFPEKLSLHLVLSTDIIRILLDQSDVISCNIVQINILRIIEIYGTPIQGPNSVIPLSSFRGIIVTRVTNTYGLIYIDNFNGDGNWPIDRHGVIWRCIVLLILRLG